MSTSSSPSSSVSYHDVAHKVDPVQIETGIDPESDDAEVMVKYPWTGGEFPNSRGTWGDALDIYSGFLPFAYLDVNVVDVLTTVGEFLESRPQTRQRVSSSELYSLAGLIDKQPGPFDFEDICLLHGWWKGGEAASSGTYYCNPDYCHDHGDAHLTRESYWDDESGEYVNERFEVAIRATRMGLSSRVVYKAYGLNEPRHVTAWLSEHGFDWPSKRKEGLRKMARTFKTLHEWGYTYPEIADAFNMPSSTVANRAADLCYDFEPPADPSYRVVRR